MKQIFRKIFVSFLICILFAGLFASPISAIADAPGDPAITDFVMDPTKPAPKSEVDFLVAFTNNGAGVSKNVSLVVDFEENVFRQIVVGDPARCTNTGITVVCNISSLDPGSTDSIGFTGIIKDDAKVGDTVKTYAAIDEPGNPDDNKQNNFKEFDVVIGNQVKTSATGAGTSVSELLKNQKTLDTPSDKQGVSLLSVDKDPNWEVSGLFTSGLKFMIRGKEALAWTLGINDSGFHNEAIKQTYIKVLTIVNSFFIIGLLIIAVMWMFSILIPRRYLRQVMLIYALAVIFVNFALPLNQLLIDGTGLLQKSFMDGVSITNIVQLPNYDDKTAVGYQNKTDFVQSTDSKKLNLNISNPDTTTPDTSGSTNGGVVVGKIQQGFLEPAYSGTISTKDSNQTVQLNSTGADVNLTLNPQQSIELSDNKTFNPNEEQSIFAFLMLIFTGLAYLGMALIFILRIVILWALMITSPVLFLLCIFHWTRSYFINWLGIYAKWLLIGPLMALGIAIVVNIWKAAGLPITSAYIDSGGFGVLTNIGFYLPGSTTVNNLSNTSQMMEYLMFLVMLYMPIIFAFILTRQKLWSGAMTAISEKRESGRKEKTSVQTASVTEVKEEKTMAEAKSLTGGIRGFFSSQLARLNKPSMPEAMKLAAGSPAPYLESATSFLPQHLALTSMRDMINLTAGEAKGSRNAHEKAVENLSNPENITDKTERQQITAVRQEISQRAEKGDVEAIRVMSEIHEKEELTKEKTQITNNEITREKIETPAIAQKADMKAIDKTIEEVMKEDIEKKTEKEQDEYEAKKETKTKRKREKIKTLK